MLPQPSTAPSKPLSSHLPASWLLDLLFLCPGTLVLTSFTWVTLCTLPNPTGRSHLCRALLPCHSPLRSPLIHGNHCFPSAPQRSVRLGAACRGQVSEGDSGKTEWSTEGALGSAQPAGTPGQDSGCVALSHDSTPWSLGLLI